MKMTTAYACAWFATALGVIGAMIITKNAWCLWAFIIPACISFHYEEDKKS